MFKYTLFKTDSARYFYDGVTANILEIDEYFYENHKLIIDAIEHRVNVSINDIQLKNHIEEMEVCIEEGNLSEISDSDIAYWFDEKSICNQLRTKYASL